MRGSSSSRDKARGEATLWSELGKTLRTREREQQSWFAFSRWREYIGVSIATFALFLSVVTLLIAIMKDSAIGSVSPLEPSGYAITRGIKPTLQVNGNPAPDTISEITSDDLVLPIDWRNSSGAPALIKEPQLELKEVEDGGDSSCNREHEDEPSSFTFFFVGEYPELSPQVLAERHSKPITYRSSFTVEPHTVSHRVMVFRIQGWTSKNQYFEIPCGKKYEATLKWSRIPGGLWQGPRDREHTLDTQLPIHTITRLLECYGEGDAHYGWDYFSLASGGRLQNYAEDITRERDPQYSCKNTYEKDQQNG